MSDYRILLAIDLQKEFADRDNDSKEYNKVLGFLEQKEIIELIDNAKLLDENTGLIKTPMGLTSVNNLSMGCKTALNVAFVRKHPELNISTINVTECGYNALEVIFSMNVNDLSRTDVSK